MPKTWRDWLEEIGDDWGEPLVYDRFDHEVSDPCWSLTVPTDEQIVAEIGDEPLPTAESKPAWSDEQSIRDEAEIVICNAVSAIMQREQDEIDAAAEQAELDHLLAKERELARLLDLVSDALGITDWHHAASGSCYATFRGRLSIRVSDHPHVPGGGWNEHTGTRHGEVDLDFYLTDSGTHDWIRESIRKRVADALREALEDERAICHA